MKTKLNRRKICIVLGGLLVVVTVIAISFSSMPFGYYDIAKDSRGGWYGGPTTRLLFRGGEVTWLYSGESGGVYFKTNGVWIWRLYKGKEFVIRPHLFSFECFDPATPIKIDHARRVLPSKPRPYEDNKWSK
jgi:hypothetical protein